MKKITEYNDVIFDINNNDQLSYFDIPEYLKLKRSKCEYEVFKSIIDYCVLYTKVEKPLYIIVNNIHDNYFKIEDQLINTNSIKTYLCFLLK